MYTHAYECRCLRKLEALDCTEIGVIESNSGSKQEQYQSLTIETSLQPYPLTFPTGHQRTSDIPLWFQHNSLDLIIV